MLGNLFLLQYFRRSSTPELSGDVTSLYDLYNEHEQRPWEVVVDELDACKIDYAIRLKTPVYLNYGLTDVQLLKLHAKSFPEYDNQLVYHALFDLYEVKYKKKTRCIFSYQDGLYTPVDDIM